MTQGHLGDSSTLSLTSPLFVHLGGQGHPSPKRPGGRAGSADRRRGGLAPLAGWGQELFPPFSFGVGKEKELGSHGNSENPHPPSLSHFQAHHTTPGDITGPGGDTTHGGATGPSCAQAGPPEVWVTGMPGAPVLPETCSPQEA